MTGIAYLISIIAMLWLGYWLMQTSRGDAKVKSNRRVKSRWWPFEYRTPDTKDAAPAEQSRPTGWRSRAMEVRRHR